MLMVIRKGMAIVRDLVGHDLFEKIAETILAVKSREPTFVYIRIRENEIFIQPEVDFCQIARIVSDSLAQIASDRIVFLSSKDYADCDDEMLFIINRYQYRFINIHEIAVYGIVDGENLISKIVRQLRTEEGL